jgi:hypothetical protein
MGRVRVPSLCFSIETLQSEVDTFRKFTSDSAWMTSDNHAVRKALTEGLTFLMLNLAEDVEQEAAWDLYHHVMDDYHETCDKLHLTY